MAKTAMGYKEKMKELSMLSLICCCFCLEPCNINIYTCDDVEVYEPPEHRCLGRHWSLSMEERLWLAVPGRGGGGRRTRTARCKGWRGPGESGGPFLPCDPHPTLMPQPPIGHLTGRGRIGVRWCGEGRASPPTAEILESKDAFRDFLAQSAALWQKATFQALATRPPCSSELAQPSLSSSAFP
ncbi:Stathmin-2 [Heterocephalus glaber]|uniref:Stathmin-2 n=1 Tax=Heterocephalus glaber TaxID=10181 RepID=G5AWJ9_HETGA|nr:Stathmin-2 [Heterocephalus glaber]